MAAKGRNGLLEVDRKSSDLRFAWLAILLCVQMVLSVEARQPNVVVILTDDQGWGDLSAHGNTNLSTPAIDSLARDGARFGSFLVSPVCSPTRAEFLTGRYHPRSGVYGTSAGGERLDLDERTIADAFKGAGYSTGAFGKWHNGMQWPYHPNARGFDEFYGFCSGHWGDYFNPPLEHNGELVQGEGFVPDDITNRAINFIDVNRDQPFFCFLAYNTPHSPMQVPDEYWDRFANRELRMRHRDPEREDEVFTRAALAMCENIDWNVGRVLDALEDRGLSDHTIVVFFCDNGPNSWRWNGGFRGRKGSTDEGGVRSPLFVRWPNGISAGVRVPQVTAAIDLMPTLCDLAGVSGPEGGRPVDGVSLKPLLQGNADEWPERIIYSHWNGRVSARDDRFRLDDKGTLYDLTVDVGQHVDVTERFPEDAARLRRAVTEWREDVLAELGEDERPFVIGHPGSRFTQIPARDAEGTGGIERSNRYPNCSFFTNWTSTDEEIRWDISLPVAGRFKVEVYYTCSIDDVGSLVELEFLNARLTARLDEAHDPPLRGMENDRIERIESYVKDFRRWDMGKIGLSAGDGVLRLKALEIPGEQVMDFRLMMLTRLE